MSDPQESSPSRRGAGDDAAGGAQTTDAAEDDVRRLDVIDTELAGVGAALQRLDEGSYGRCEVCGVTLSAEAIEANPLATRCPDHPG